jgi:monoamine oxidase
MIRTENESCDVVVVGAGAAGLACARHLLHEGQDILVIEARNRIGGRVHSIAAEGHDLELGAEFLHGAPEVLPKDLHERLLFLDVLDHHHVLRKKKLHFKKHFWEEIEKALKSLNEKRKNDRSFQDFLSKKKMKGEIKDLVISLVEGFYGADVEKVGEKGLARAEEAEVPDLNGRDLFRPLPGWGSVLDGLLSSEEKSRVLRINHRLEKIEWKPSRCVLRGEGPTGTFQIQAKKCIVTLPLGVLQSKNFFEPLSPAFEKFLSGFLSGLHMGHVQKLSFEFSSRFWETLTPEPVGFLHAPSDQDFPTWWTEMPLRLPRLVAWQGGPKAYEMAAWSEEKIVTAALRTLSFLTRKNFEFLKKELRKVHTHNWSQDPLSQGAYSYPGINGESQGPTSFENTLYFAGEAFIQGSARGTVHGALESGFQTAREIASTFKSPAKSPARHTSPKPKPTENYNRPASR